MHNSLSGSNLANRRGEGMNRHEMVKFDFSANEVLRRAGLQRVLMRNILKLQFFGYKQKGERMGED